MKITRQTETELVFRDSTFWLAGVFAVCSLLMALVVLKSGTPRGLIGAGLLLLFSTAWLRRSTVVFDAARRMIRWTGIRLGRNYSKSVPFGEVTNIVTQSTGGPNGTTIYRLAVVADDQTIPFCDAYSGGGAARYEALREAALKVLAGTARVSAGAADSDGLDASIRSLLEQGRTLDAIELARASDRITLTAARQRVREIRQEMSAVR
ncbi:MAG TPA: hypothetical protein VHX37_13680 [Acidobacteriaceae bacterium]|jgi:hypothetical protein|nr:hypothetical protein [Acidobacteriaceae bacterium]